MAHGRSVLPADEIFDVPGHSASSGPVIRLLQGLWGAGTRCIFFDLTYMHAGWPRVPELKVV